MKYAASLFSGIGGFDLAAQWAGYENAFYCEYNEFGQRVLKYYWQNAKSYGDITTTDFIIWRNKIHILTGGFPCQPFSTAGNRKGKEDRRYLWPEMLRAIREIRPTWIIGENVVGIISMVQPGDEIEVESQITLFETDNKETILEQEFVIETICTDLEREGYSVQPIVIPACAIGAPHRRDRVWFVAYANEYSTGSPGKSGRVGENRGNNIEQPKERRKSTELNFGQSNVRQIATNSSNSGFDGLRPRTNEIYGLENVANTKCEGLEKPENNSAHTDSGRQPGKEYGKTKSGFSSKESVSNYWSNFPTQSPICNGNDGISDRLVGITFPKWRNESIKAMGNAIVPQIAYEIMKAINELENKL